MVVVDLSIMKIINTTKVYNKTMGGVILWNIHKMPFKKIRLSVPTACLVIYSSLIPDWKYTLNPGISLAILIPGSDSICS